MAKQKCNYAEQCPVFSGKLKEDNKPLFLYHNIFCLAGRKGWNACKRHEIYELGLDPGSDLLPENNEQIEDLIDRIKNENT